MRYTDFENTHGYYHDSEAWTEEGMQLIWLSPAMDHSVVDETHIDFIQIIWAGTTDYMHLVLTSSENCFVLVPSLYPSFQLCENLIIEILWIHMPSRPHSILRNAWQRFVPLSQNSARWNNHRNRYIFRQNSNKKTAEACHALLALPNCEQIPNGSG